MNGQGKAGKVITAVLGVHADRKHQNRLVIDSIRRKNREVISDRALIHKDITDVFRESLRKVIRL